MPTIAKLDRMLAERLILLVATAGCLSPGLVAQAYTPPPPPLTSAPCVPTKKDPCAVPQSDQVPVKPVADKFPFPGDAPAAGSAADKFPFPGEVAPAAPTAQKPAGAFPYPGDPAAPSGSSSSSSSSSSAPVGDPSSDDADGAAKPSSLGKGAAALRSGRRPLPKVEDLSAREAEDIEVSKFYIQTNDYLGAYTRAKDAVRLMPDDSEAVWSLAVAADKMKKPDEAVTAYKAYLKAEPDGDHLRAANLALKRLTGK